MSSVFLHGHAQTFSPCSLLFRHLTSVTVRGGARRDGGPANTPKNTVLYPPNFVCNLQTANLSDFPGFFAEAQDIIQESPCYYDTWLLYGLDRIELQ